MSTLFRTATRVLAAGVALALGSLGVAHRAPAATSPRVVTATVATARPATPAPTIAGCPVSGQRVKSVSSPNVYLVDPAGYYDLIPDENVYFSLWDTWNGITTVSDSTLQQCIVGVLPMTGAYLSKASNSPYVYIYDATIGGYNRWITTGDVFNKYGFGWDKIITVPTVTRIDNAAPWNR